MLRRMCRLGSVRLLEAFSLPMNLRIRRPQMVESVLPHPSPLPLGEGEAAACLDCMDSVVANPAAGFPGEPLTPALSPSEGEREDAQAHV